ncbi:MAG: methyltransferase domain-containing protein [Gemmatimonadetes bacterium]|nr:methyltransferase domain-containing protein [Gemmatimonadota bacterium]MDA1103113.1 methyltransferase domain-containing protein [Gemmatimonadota bacterium]
MSILDLVVPDLSFRRHQAELMDDPGLDPVRHRRALRALGRVNRISFAAERVWGEVRRLHEEMQRPVRVLDIACGGADVLVHIARQARRSGVPVELSGCDISPVALAEARRLASGEAAVDVFELDVLREDLPSGFDLMTTSLFLHHLSREDAVALLRRMSERTERALLVQDLRRTRLGYVLAWVGLHTLTTSDVARADGLVSVRAAFTTEEVADLCREAALIRAEIAYGWPQRFTIRWERA